MGVLNTMHVARQFTSTIFNTPEPTSPRIVDAIVFCYISNTYPTLESLIEDYRKNSDRETLHEYLCGKVMQDRRVLSFKSDNNKIQMTEEFYKHGQKLYIEAESSI